MWREEPASLCWRIRMTVSKIQKELGSSQLLRGWGGGTSLSQGSPHPQQRQSPRGTHKAVCWCGLSLGSEEHADLFAGRKDQESPRLGASGGLGDVQDWGAITQGTRRCEDRAAQPP